MAEEGGSCERGARPVVAVVLVGGFGRDVCSLAPVFAAAAAPPPVVVATGREILTLYQGRLSQSWRPPASLVAQIASAALLAALVEAPGRLGGGGAWLSLSLSLSFSLSLSLSLSLCLSLSLSLYPYLLESEG